MSYILTMSAYSKISSKAQTVIPKEIRDRLGLKPGDTILYKITSKGVEIQRADMATDDPFAMFTEWASEADEKAYGKL